MRQFNNFVMAVVAAAVLFGAGLPVQAQTRPAAEKISPEQFDQKLQDTRSMIQKQTTAPQGNQTTHQFTSDICKKNPNLPQCKL